MKKKIGAFTSLTTTAGARTMQTAGATAGARTTKTTPKQKQQLFRNLKAWYKKER